MKAVIYLEKLSLDYFAEKMQAIPKLVFPADVIRDIEVLDVAKLDQAIKGFIDTNKLTPASVTIVLASSVVFTKDFLKPDPKKVAVDKDGKKLPPVPTSPATPEVSPKDSQEESIEQFLETVPFNEVSSIRLPIQNGIKVIAANKDMFTDIKRAFEKYGFTTDAVAPLISFGASVQPIDQVVAKRLLMKVDLAKQHNLLTRPVPQAKSFGTPSKPGEKVETNKTRIYIMLGVFALLFLVMGYMIYTTFISPPPLPAKKAKPAPAVAIPSPEVSPTLTTPIGSESASADLSDLTVQIVSGTASASDSTALREALTEAGVKTVTTRRSTSVPAKSIIAHTKDLLPDQKSSIQKIVQKVIPTVSLLESEDLASDVVITIGEPAE